MSRTEKRMRKFTLRSCSSSNNAKLKLTDLPIEILVNIFLRLPVKALCYIECASKTLFNIISGPFSTTLLARLLSTKAANVVTRQVPQLMCFARVECEPDSPFVSREVMALQFLKYDDGNNTLTKAQHAIDFSWILKPDEDSSYKRIYFVHFVFRNLVCLKNRLDPGRCFLINPYLSGEVLRLPASNLYSNGSTLRTEGEWYGMGFDNITNTHKIVRVSTNYDINDDDVFDQQSTEVLVLGGTSSSWNWRQIPTFSPCNLNTSRSLCAYGDMHWLVRDFSREGSEGSSHIISFDFKKEEFYWMPHPTLRSPAENLHFISLRGSMAIVDISSTFYSGNVKIKILVLKDFDKKEWTREYYTTKIGWDPYPCFGSRNSHFHCGEWEHGLFFKNICSRSNRYTPKKRNHAFCLDLRRVSMKSVICPVLVEEIPENTQNCTSEDTRIFSFPGI